MQKTSTPITTKAWLCLLAVGFLVLLAACGSAPSPTGTGTTPTAAPTATPTPTTAPTATPTANPTPTAASSSGNSVSIMNFSFTPNSLTVTANQGAFNSPVLPGSSFSFTFTKAGTYAYHCMIHPYMMATIVVQ